VTRTATDIAVIGAGPAGLTAAIALVAAGAAVTLVGKPAGDTRTTALLASSVTALETLEIWPRCRDRAAPLKVMRIVDATGRLWRAPETEFVSEEIGLDAFGWNISNRDLVAALAAQAEATANLTSVAQNARSIVIGDDEVLVTLENGDEISARLLVGADGRNSMCRTAAGIETQGFDYPQTALTFNLAHTRPHRDISTEFHTPHGPFTLVPLPGLHSSLVWVVKPEEAERIFALDDTALSREIEQHSHSIFGKITAAPERGRFPLAVQTADRFAAHRVALIGEAAHTLPPIGAQGFNLGLRDVATLAELIAQTHRTGEDIAGEHVTRRYDELRRADTATRKLAIDLFNRSLLTDFLPVQGARGLGLYLLDQIGPLRRAVMREGVTPAASAPKLMRGEAL
jgi:2-octaprenyl-6-methoxyphenol hydroxylase